ncbi:hypothetical protein A3A74_06355 [Candidatus Roizmanbacteria bacterium RIFCSPLOWO2_01_FULL_35_13]|uniref:Glycosyltransferase subfamily 4-like N-terminal domain-containing protein n=1 Tax=Candidatus Roizmanbacteria bacterium RIFCSPLOWO2_01_FULL_35_13 TaxID=1802055 RepID=A0A1F7IGY6_9BACT|nr:MAG: hypothetical protein A3A74_06355 [Candidatus Roizmanbacteria bacterium RIFCSPLOWO2_01_FULL_35_13]
MKIILIEKDKSLRIDGIGMFTNRLYDYLTDRNHEVYILRFSNNVNNEKNTFNIPYYIASIQNLIILPTEDSLAILKKYLIRLKPDLVYTPIGFSPLDIFLPTLCHELGIPIVGAWHMDFNQSMNSYQILFKSLFLAYTPICKQMDLLHVFSDKLAKFYIAKGVEPKKILTLSNGVDPRVYKRKQTSQFARENKIKRGILFLGRLNMQKNPDLLIKSFLSLHPPESIKLVMAGNGEMEENLREEFGNESRILFTGLVEDESKKIDIINSCDIFVLPSKFEGVSLSLLEGMSCELACIASDAGSNSEVLGEAGIVIRLSQLKNQLPLAMRILLDYPVLSDYLAKKSRKRILKSYSQEIIFSKLVSRLEQVVFNFKIRRRKTEPIDINEKIFNKIEDLWKKAKDYIAQE